MYTLHDLAVAKRLISLPDFYCQSIYVQRLGLSDALLDQVTVSSLEKEQGEQSISALWPERPSDESLCEAAIKFSDKESEDQMLNEETPKPLLEPHKEDMLWEPLEEKLVSAVIGVLICFLVLRHLSKLIKF